MKKIAYLLMGTYIGVVITSYIIYTLAAISLFASVYAVMSFLFWTLIPVPVIGVIRICAIMGLILTISFICQDGVKEHLEETKHYWDKK